ncbi:MAG: hypothetical protein JSV01_03150 [Desulfobacterales bacterium]|nr:MAG: hypothetical protein JSV01_03150 [Desulfobacterales bacterium]
MPKVGRVAELSEINEWGVFGTLAVVMDRKVKRVTHAPKWKEIPGWPKRQSRASPVQRASE